MMNGGKHKETVAVMMSGGVDSSVAAALLVGEGRAVVGFTLVLFPPPEPGGEAPAVEDARRAARALGIPHHVIDAREEFRRSVVEPFCRSYLAGETPNPCVSCNEKIKFGLFIRRALAAGAGAVATGHYARIGAGASGPVLLKGCDTRRDQSYFLYRLRRGTLGRIIFPVGALTREEVHGRARALGLPNAGRPSSQEICFIGGRGYGAFLSGRAGGAIRPGPVVGPSGEVLGRHRGAPFYTVGQRAGLGVSGPRPLYVLRIDARANTVHVGEKEAAYRKSFQVGATNWLLPAPRRAERFLVRVRHGAREIPGLARPVAGGLFRVDLEEPHFAVAPGQSAVFYRGEAVAGGGIIRDPAGGSRAVSGAAPRRRLRRRNTVWNRSP